MIKDEKKIDQLAKNVINLARNTLIINLRFMDSAISVLGLKTCKGLLATDAKYIYYDPEQILRAYKIEQNLPCANYMHILLHCIFRHYITNPNIDKKLWDLSCDIAVENIIEELNLPCLDVNRTYAQKNILRKLRTKIGKITAKKLYIFYKEMALSDEEIDEIHKIFIVDDHSLWYKKDKEKDVKIVKAKAKDIESKESRTISADSIQGASISRKGIDSEGEDEEDVDEIWENISKKMQVDLETFSKSKGQNSGGMIQNLKAINRQKYDYSDFLKKFAVLGETIKINEQEFDYIFYSYGLELYGNVPLIEPLEYKEDFAIKEFVVAIDTSASVSGNLVQKFLEKTYNILKQEESFARKINLRILQCDASIQEDVKISSKNEFDNYIKNMSLKGFGCTDFRPVFNHVEMLKAGGELKNLKGLIYFTDGYGSFPIHKPDYKTAFIFIDDDYANPDVPVWAIKLVLQSDEI